MSIITAKFESTCPSCDGRIEVGSKVNWARGQKASHVECPRGARIAIAALRTEEPATIELLCAIVNGDAEGDAVAAQEGLDILEDRFFREYEQAKGFVAGSKVTDPFGNLREAPVEAPSAPQILKGIYRVSLTGAERRYGVDHVNLQLVPNEKYGSVKVSEWQGESLGRIGRDGRFVFWPSFEDRTGVRTLALLAALDIVRGSADPVQYAKAYAAESQTCWRCGADLVDERSRERLLGPECYRQVAKSA